MSFGDVWTDWLRDKRGWPRELIQLVGDYLAHTAEFAILWYNRRERLWDVPPRFLVYESYANRWNATNHTETNGALASQNPLIWPIPACCPITSSSVLADLRRHHSLRRYRVLFMDPTVTDTDNVSMYEWLLSNDNMRHIRRSCLESHRDYFQRPTQLVQRPCLLPGYAQFRGLDFDWIVSSDNLISVHTHKSPLLSIVREVACLTYIPNLSTPTEQQHSSTSTTGWIIIGGKRRPQIHVYECKTVPSEQQYLLSRFAGRPEWPASSKRPIAWLSTITLPNHRRSWAMSDIQDLPGCVRVWEMDRWECVLVWDAWSVFATALPVPTPAPLSEICAERENHSVDAALTDGWWVIGRDNVNQTNQVRHVDMTRHTWDYCTCAATSQSITPQHHGIPERGTASTQPLFTNFVSHSPAIKSPRVISHHTSVSNLYWKTICSTPWDPQTAPAWEFPLHSLPPEASHAPSAALRSNRLVTVQSEPPVVLIWSIWPLQIVRRLEFPVHLGIPLRDFRAFDIVPLSLDSYNDDNEENTRDKK